MVSQSRLYLSDSTFSVPEISSQLGRYFMHQLSEKNSKPLQYDIYASFYLHKMQITQK